MNTFPKFSSCPKPLEQGLIDGQDSEWVIFRNSVMAGKRRVFVTELKLGSWGHRGRSLTTRSAFTSQTFIVLVSLLPRLVREKQNTITATQTHLHTARYLQQTATGTNPTNYLQQHAHSHSYLHEITVLVSVVVLPSLGAHQVVNMWPLRCRRRRGCVVLSLLITQQVGG